MQELIAGFSEQLNRALEKTRETKLKAAEKPIHQVLICGLGGSGITGSMIAELLSDRVRVPVLVNKNYELPAFVGENTLVIACSYSGNTEETLICLQAAIAQNAMVACLTSGGKLHDLAQKNGYNVLELPPGNPPRSMLAYSFVYLLHYFHFYGLCQIKLDELITRSRVLIDADEQKIQQRAKEIAQKIQGKIVATYACRGMGALAERVRQQLNENSKMLGWNGVIPEMNHNELVGWAAGSDALASIFLRSAFEHPRNSIRAEINKKIIEKYTPYVIEIRAEGAKSLEEEVLYLTHLTDWLSFYLSEIHKVDIFDIKVIEHLKGELGLIS